MDLMPRNNNEPSGNFTNGSMPNTTEFIFGDAPSFDELNLINILVKGTMFIVSLFGNLSTIVQMYRMRRRKSTINTLIINLATADLLVTFFCMGSDAIWQSTVQWYAGDFMCKAVKFAQVFAFNLSTYVTVMISLDRCFAIMDPISRNKAPKRVKIMIIVSWCLCALFSIPQVCTLFYLSKLKMHMLTNCIITLKFIMYTYASGIRNKMHYLKIKRKEERFQTMHHQSVSE